MAKITATILDAIETLLEKKRFLSVRDVLITLNPTDIALIFEDTLSDKLTLLFRLLPKELAAEVFVEMGSDAQEKLISCFSDYELKGIIDELYMDDVVDVIEEMPAGVVKRILRQTDARTRQSINELLQYSQDSAGSIMTTEFADLTQDMTASQAIERIRRTGIDKETIDVCYVIDSSRRLMGVVSLRALILAPSQARVFDIMNQSVISANTTDDKEEVANMFTKYGFTALPIVDGENRLVGIVTVDDAMEVIKDETTEDIEKMAAITPSDKPYMRLSALEIYKKRIPWLLVLMLSATITGLVIKHFESALAAQIALTAFIPMLMDTSGNSGSQASVTIIRGLALNEIRFADILRIVWKEIRVAVLCGLSLSAVTFLKLMYFDRVGVAIAAVVSITLCIAVLIAKTIGCSLPLLVKRAGLDPAVMASPLITTIVDAVALLVYFAMATSILNI